MQREHRPASTPQPRNLPTSPKVTGALTGLDGVTTTEAGVTLRLPALSWAVVEVEVTPV